MDIGSIFLILALLILVVMFISRPFFENRSRRRLSDSEDHEISHWLAERDRILNALQELDFDYTLGKIPEEDYPAQRAVLMQHGADALRHLDALQETEAVDAEERLEAAIAARRADMRQPSRQAVGAAAAVGGAAIAAPDDELEVMLANRRRQRQGRARGFCPQCGGPVQQSDKFCPKCGEPLKRQ